MRYQVIIDFETDREWSPEELRAVVVTTTGSIAPDASYAGPPIVDLPPGHVVRMRARVTPENESEDKP